MRTPIEGSSAPNDVQFTCSSWTDLRPWPEIVEALGGVHTIFAVTPFLGKPRSSGTVRVSSTDHRVPPRIDLNYLADPEERALMRSAVRVAWKVMTSSQMSTLGGEPLILNDELVADDEQLDGVIDALVTTGYHCAGTARMGADGDPAAATDQQGRVGGCDGLRVVDASQMPTVPSGNTHLPVVMIAEKIADELRGGA
jgi:choline dehydrogenase